MKLFHQMQEAQCNSTNENFLREKFIELNTDVNIQKHFIESMYSVESYVKYLCNYIFYVIIRVYRYVQQYSSNTYIL